MGKVLCAEIDSPTIVFTVVGPEGLEGSGGQLRGYAGLCMLFSVTAARQ